MKVNVEVKKLDDRAIVPSYAHDTDACFDLHAIEEYELKPHKQVLVKTGLAYKIPVGYEIQVRPRSGHAYKSGVTVLNAPGTIDSDYRGDLGVILINHSNNPFIIKQGSRIAQASIKPVITAEFTLVEELNDTERSDGGFGSTGDGTKIN